eukprot:6652473-Prymnesium_polylepis.1
MPAPLHPVAHPSKILSRRSASGGTARCEGWWSATWRRGPRASGAAGSRTPPPTAPRPRRRSCSWMSSAGAARASRSLSPTRRRPRHPKGMSRRSAPHHRTWPIRRTTMCVTAHAAEHAGCCVSHAEGSHFPGGSSTPKLASPSVSRMAL